MTATNTMRTFSKYGLITLEDRKVTLIKSNKLLQKNKILPISIGLKYTSFVMF